MTGVQTCALPIFAKNINKSLVLIDESKSDNSTNLNNARVRLSQDETKKVFDENKQEIFEMIQNNISYRKIAERFNFHLYYLFKILNSDENKKLKDDSLEISSYQEIDNAKQCLEDIKDDDSNARVRKLTELSKFHVYLAQAKNQKMFNLNYKEKDESTNQQIIVIPPNYSQIAVSQEKKTINNNDNSN